MSRLDPAPTTDDAQLRTTQTRERPFLERYRIERALKSTAERQSYLAEDLVEGGRVVLRIASASVAADVQVQLAHEAAMLETVACPWLAPLREFGRHDDRPYWVRPFVEGIPLRSYAPRPLHQALAVSRCLLTAMKALHAAGVLCRTLRPSNLILPDGELSTSAVLTDFGLACNLTADTDANLKAVDDVLYLSPEGAGSLDYDVGEPSDLYSVGALLFELLSGRPPYSGAAVGDVLLRHMTAHIPELRALGFDVPRALDEIIQRLLRKDPRDRYQSAEAVLVDLSALEEAIDRGDPDPEIVVGQSDRRRTLTEAAFVGRTRELQRLDLELKNLRLGRSSFIAVDAVSGGGKTRLLDEFARRARSQGIWVLRGTGSNQIGQRPFQVLDGVIRELLSVQGTDPALVERLRRVWASSARPSPRPCRN